MNEYHKQRHFSVYLNNQYVGNKPMVENNGEDLLKMDAHLKQNGITGYIMSNYGDEIKIQMDGYGRTEEMRNCLANYLNP